MAVWGVNLVEDAVESSFIEPSCFIVAEVLNFIDRQGAFFALDEALVPLETIKDALEPRIENLPRRLEQLDPSFDTVSCWP
jgi:hypothetical protein